MKYKIYTSDWIEKLVNEQLIGEANSYQEACALIKQQIPQSVDNPYWRLLLAQEATFIDYGSYSKFVAIMPPLTIDEIK